MSSGSPKVSMVILVASFMGMLSFSLVSLSCMNMVGLAGSIIAAMLVFLLL